MGVVLQKEAFTLVEMAIVIVVIGVLVVGIAAGFDMVKQAQLRAFITDMRFYKVSYNNFLGRYNKIPGDMENASSYFANCAATNTNCDGDNDGVIECALTTANDEITGAWSQMHQAGMLDTGIRPTPDSANGGLELGLDSPIAGINGVGYFFAGPGTGVLACNGSSVQSPFIGVENAVFAGSGEFTDAAHINGALTPDEAFNFDRKIDDGLIDSSANFLGASTGEFRAVEGDASAANSCHTAGAYNVSNQSRDCLVGLAGN